MATAIHPDARMHASGGTRDLTKLPGTVDRGRFVGEDFLTIALTPSTGPHVGGLSSKSVRDCRLSANSAPRIRSKAPVGITGGYVEAGKGENVRWGIADTSALKAARNAGRRTGKNARKRAMRNAG